MGSKKSGELSIFNLLFGKKTDITVQRKDKPDFWLTNRQNLQFGIEITELFFNESEARLNKIDNYLKELLDSKSYKHKDDIENLDVSEITIIDENGIEKIKTNAVIHKTSGNRDSYATNLENRIEEKNLQLLSYEQGFAFYNLIIRDHDNHYPDLDPENVYRIVFTDKMINLLKGSNYDEIFLVTRFDRVLTALPLRGILFLSRLFLFNEVLDKLSENKLYTIEEFHHLFYEFLVYEKFKNVKIRQGEADREVIYGNFGILVSADKKITIREYSTFRLDESKLLEPTVINFINDEIAEIINSVYQRFGFATSFGYSLKHAE